MGEKQQPENNIAYVDGQNLYMGTNNIDVDYRRFASSLYKKIRTIFYDALDAPDIKRKIGRQKEKGSLGS